MIIEKEKPSELDIENKKMTRRDFLKKGARALGGVAVVLTGAEKLVEAGERILSSEDLPLPDLKLDDLSEKDFLSFASDLLSRGSSYEQAFEKLGLNEKKTVAGLLYHRNNLVLRAIRARLLDRRAHLNFEQIRKFDKFTNDLKQYGILLYNSKDFAKWADDQGKDELAEIYSYEEQLYESYGREKKKLKPQEEKTIKVEKKEITKKEEHKGLDKEKEKKKEGEKRLLDKYGQPVGIRFTHKFVEREPHYSDLVVFTGRTTRGQSISLKLRREAYLAFVQMKELARKSGLDIDAVEAFRTFEKQQSLRRRFGRGAATPGYSEHHLGTTIDIFRANRPKNFNWLIDNAVKYGFVPTMVYEPWHYRYIGREQASEFMKRYKKEIVANQRRRLVR